MECLQAMESCSIMKVQDAERPLLQGKLQGKYKQDLVSQIINEKRIDICCLQEVDIPRD